MWNIIFPICLFLDNYSFTILIYTVLHFIYWVFIHISKWIPLKHSLLIHNNRNICISQFFCGISTVYISDFVWCHLLEFSRHGYFIPYLLFQSGHTKLHFSRSSAQNVCTKKICFLLDDISFILKKSYVFNAEREKAYNICFYSCLF